MTAAELVAMGMSHRRAREAARLSKRKLVKYGKRGGEPGYQAHEELREALVHGAEIPNASPLERDIACAFRDAPPFVSDRELAVRTGHEFHTVRSALQRCEQKYQKANRKPRAL